MTLIEKLYALTPKQREKLYSIAAEQELDIFLAEIGAELAAEEKAAVWNYVQAGQKKPDDVQTGKAALADEELDNVAGGHGGMCHKGTREVVSLVQWCVHGHKRYCDGCEHLSYESALWLCNLPDDMKAY